MNPTLPANNAPGRWSSLALAAFVHALLLLLLFYGVRWQNRPHEALEVALVAPLSAPAAPAAEAPMPPPRPEAKPVVRPEPKLESQPQPKTTPPRPAPAPPSKPEIAIRAEPPKKVEKPQKPKAEAPPKAEARPDVKTPPKPTTPTEKRADPLEEQRKAMEDMLAADTKRVHSVEAQRQASAELERAAIEEGQKLASARAKAAANSRALADYINKIKTKIRGNIVLPPGIGGNPEAVFLVDQAPGGEVLTIRLKKSSGDPALDAAIERAINKSNPLPAPDNPDLFQRSLELKFRPLED